MLLRLAKPIWSLPTMFMHTSFYICGVTRGIKQVLASDDGVFIFEVHYLGKVLNGYQYDMIYHEHLYYYSLIALLNHFSRHDTTILMSNR